MRILIMIICCVGLLLVSCQTNIQQSSPFDRIEDVRARQILKQAMEVAGGYDRWLSIDSMVYTKKSILYHEDSTTESEVLQQHFYRFHPDFEAEITWLDDSLSRKLIYTAEKVEMHESDTIVALNNESHRQSVMSALYVLAQPFKLLDAGTQLTYEGQLTLPNGKRADVLHASYDPGAHDNHSTQDLWWYHFEVGSGAFLGSMVYHPPTYAWIENISFAEDTPVKFHASRNSFRVDSLMNIQYLRASFEYSNYQIWE